MKYMPRNQMYETEDAMVSETGNWNVADVFAKKKIMLPMEKSDAYEDIATYGFDSFLAELMQTNIQVDELKVRGLIRLVNELIKLTKNTMFAMRKGNTKKDLKKLQEQLYEIKRDILPNTYKTMIDQGNNTTSLVLQKKLFEMTLEKVSDIKSRINEPLNRNHLIFTDKEEFDPEAFKTKIRERIVNKG